MSVWKDSRELGREAAIVAVALAKRQPVKGASVFNGGEKKISMNSILLKPMPITKDKLDAVIKGGWISKDVVCKGVDKAAAPAACK